MKDLAEERNVFNTTLLIWFLVLQLIMTNEAFTMNGSTHTHKRARVSCNICQRTFKTNRELQQHLVCRRKNRECIINSKTDINDSNNIAADNNIIDSSNSDENGDHETYFWNEVSRTVF